jgi:hypothetical protein
MENLLKGLLVVGGVNKVTSVSETASVEVSGRFTIERGNFKQEFSYLARTYDKLVGFAKVNDYETEDHKPSLGELPIDNISKFIQSLEDSGLNTLAKCVGFTHEEVRKAMYEHIQNHKIFKAVYGKKVVLWDMLSKEEQQIEYTKFAINTFDTCPEYIKRECGFVGKDDEGNTIQHYTPTLEELKSRLEELTK